MKSIIFLDPVLEEMTNAAKFYEHHTIGLGEEFLEEIEYITKRIQEFPKSGRILRNKVRRRLAKRFPFGVLYIEDKEIIIIVAVMHLHRRPNYWVKRLDILPKSSV